jgi:hypothetical protein
MRGRCGELLATWPAHFAAEERRIGWIRASQDEFDAAHAAELLAAAGIVPEHGTLSRLWILVWHLTTVTFLRQIWLGKEILDPGRPKVETTAAR